MTNSTSFTLTFPGAPVTRSLTLDDMRAHLRANGWRHVGTAEGDAESERWEIEGDHLSFYTSSHDAGAGSVVCAVALLAVRANVTAGEMLVRIAQQPDAAVLAERERIAAMLRARANFSSGALAEALEDVATGVRAGETDPAARALHDPPPEEVQRRATERRIRAAGIKAIVRQWCRDNLDDPEVLAEVRDAWGNHFALASSRAAHVNPGHAYNVFRRRFPMVHEALGDIAADEWTVDDVSVEDVEAAIRERGAK